MSSGPVVFRPRRALRTVWSVVVLVVGVLVLLGSRQHRGEDGQTLSCVAEVVMIAGGLRGIAMSLRGAPLLSVDADGLSLRRLLGTVRLRWDQIGPLNVVVANEGRWRERVLFAWAAVPSRRRRRRLVIPDRFDVPLPVVLAVIARLRDASSGVVGTGVVRPSARSFGVAGFRFPWLTACLVVAFVAIYALQRQAAHSVDAIPTLALIQEGGLNWNLVRAGEWFRPFCGPFLHSSVGHLVGNCMLFAVAGSCLEYLVGRSWAFVVFAAGALAGAAGSVLLSHAMVSVGASGGILASTLALAVLGFRIPKGRVRTLSIFVGRMGVLALLPFGTAVGIVRIDYGAHLGGGLFGVLAGCALLWLWRDDARIPGGRRFAAIASLVLVAFYGAAAYADAGRWPSDRGTAPVSSGARLPMGRDAMPAPSDVAASRARYAARIPADRLPRTEAEIAEVAQALLTAYPGDPLSYMYGGIAFSARGYLPLAEAQFRLGLSMASPPAGNVSAETKADLLSYLALVISAQRRVDSAVSVAAPVCAGVEVPAASLLSSVRRAGLCRLR